MNAVLCRGGQVPQAVRAAVCFQPFGGKAQLGRAVRVTRQLRKTCDGPHGTLSAKWLRQADQRSLADVVQPRFMPQRIGDMCASVSSSSSPAVTDTA